MRKLHTSGQDFVMLRDLIRSDQMTPEQVEHLLEDRPDFADWYRRQG